TPHGAAIARLPLPPRLGHMLVRAGEMGLGTVAAEVAVLLGERGLGGPDADLEVRLRRWRSERGQRAEAGRRLAKRWAGLIKSSLLRGEDLGEGQSRTQHSETAPLPTSLRSSALSPEGRGLATAIALAFPDRIARRRDSSGETWASAGGRGFKLDPASSLARAEWLAVAETQGMAAGARILSAAAIDQATVEALFGDRIETQRTVAFDPATGGVQASRVRRLGAIRLSSGPDADPDRKAIAAALLKGVRAHGLKLLPWNDAAQALLARVAFLRGLDRPVGDLDAASLLARADEWLAPLLANKRRLDTLDTGALAEALRGMIGWDTLKLLDAEAPTHFHAPTGTNHSIDYAAEGGPRVDLRPQELFGLAAHPAIAGGTVPLVLSLTSPAGRPIQTTRDLPGFWRGSWADVAREMRGRYPRHPWPDDPAGASPTTRTKNADARAREGR
ncbi:ATP-dependent helicase C-terminal domain-containing protein, partial [Sphingomonas immobilis]